MDKADTFPVHRVLSDAEPGDYSALVLPGGVVNADELRMAPGVTTFVQRIFEAGKPVAVVCHGSWALVEADLVRGRTLTSWPSLQTDLRNAAGRLAGLFPSPGPRPPVPEPGPGAGLI